jgi:hypothetical protein
MTALRRLAVLGLTLSLALTGPLASLASAQQPAAPAQPELVPEGMKPDARAPVATAFQPPPTMQPEVLKPADRADSNEAFYSGFARVANAFWIPGHAVTCVLGSTVAVGVLFITFGSGYRAATRVVEEGCGGKWVLQGDDLRSSRIGVNTPF